MAANCETRCFVLLSTPRSEVFFFRVHLHRLPCIFSLIYVERRAPVASTGEMLFLVIEDKLSIVSSRDVSAAAAAAEAF